MHKQGRCRDRRDLLGETLPAAPSLAASVVLDPSLAELSVSQRLDHACCGPLHGAVCIYSGIESGPRLRWGEGIAGARCRSTECGH